MPTVDIERGALVVRVVYDGPPLAGKTTTLRTLAERLGADVVTPEERDGRTQFFDWVDYVGGLFDGKRIRCQIVSVPGQEELADRRELLLSSADVVVLVADTRAEELEVSLDLMRELVPRCRGESPPVGLVVQANKRDDPQSVPGDELRARVNAIAPAALVETIATNGEGVREAFVFGVRLALDRARSLSEASALLEGRPEIDSPAELLECMEELALERPSQLPSSDAQVEDASVFELAPHRRHVDAARSTEGEPAFVPDPMIPGGRIWPPVDGRMFLREVAALGPSMRRTSGGDWWAQAGEWFCHSVAEARFESSDEGRAALISWARTHVENLDRLAGHRVLILADSGPDDLRLWQLLRTQTSLRDRLVEGVRTAGVRHLVREVRTAALQLHHARKRLGNGPRKLPCTLATLSADLTELPRYVGFVPGHGEALADEPEGRDLVEREFTPLLELMERERPDFDKITRRLGHVRKKDVDTPLEALASYVTDL